jgi:hypothetical protein
MVNKIEQGMNQFNISQIKDIACKIRNMLNRKKLKDTTLNNLFNEYNQRGDDFYLALDWLARENEIFFLVTAKDTYVLPIG